MDKRIQIKRKEFDDLVNTIYTTFMNANSGTWKEQLSEAFEKYIFDVEPKFEVDGWNKCTIKPPSEHFFKDVIIRKRDVFKDSAGHSNSMSAYTVGYYSTLTKSFETQDATFLKNGLENFEYKLIK